VTQPSPPETPRTWLPLIIAGSVALLVIAGAIITHMVRADLSPQKRAAVDACEAQYTQQFPKGPGITGGDVYSATEWSALDARLVALGLQPQQHLTGEQIDARNDEAAALVASGADRMTIVWQLNDETHAQCIAELKGTTVTTASVSSLVEPVGPTPSPTPAP